MYSFKKKSFVSIKFANISSFLLLLIMLFLFITFLCNWKIEWTKTYILENIIRMKTLIMYFFLIASIPIHEYIHAITFYFFVKDKTTIKVGFDKYNITPYCHCSQKLLLWQYMIAIAMPLIVLGILPCILAVFYKDVMLLLCAEIEICCAGADLLVIFIALYHGNYKKYVVDHPTQVGFLVIDHD